MPEKSSRHNRRNSCVSNELCTDSAQVFFILNNLRTKKRHFTDNDGEVVTDVVAQNQIIFGTFIDGLSQKRKDTAWRC